MYIPTKHILFATVLFISILGLAFTSIAKADVAVDFQFGFSNYGYQPSYSNQYYNPYEGYGYNSYQGGYGSYNPYHYGGYDDHRMNFGYGYGNYYPSHPDFDYRGAQRYYDNVTRYEIEHYYNIGYNPIHATYSGFAQGYANVMAGAFGF